MLAAIVALAGFIRIYALDFGLPFTQARPDETFVIDAALKLLSGVSPGFFDYPWLFIWFVVIGDLGYFLFGTIAGWFGSIADMVASWPSYWAPFFLIPRTIAAIAGTLTVAVAFRLGCQIRNSATGLVAALFMAFAFLHIRSSHFGTTDTSMTLFIALSVSWLLEASERGTTRAYALGGLCAGMAAATKYNAVLLLAPIAVVLAWRAVDAKEARFRALLSAPVGWMVLLGLIAFAVGIPFVVFDYDRFMAAMNDLAASMRYGDERLGQSSGWRYHLEYSLRYGLGLPLLVTGIAGMVTFGASQPRRASIVLAFPLFYFLVAGSIRNLFFRYTIPLLPFLVVSAAYLVTLAADRIAARWAAASREQWRVAGWLAGGVAVALIVSSAIRVVQFERILAATDNRVLVIDWVEANIPDGDSFLQSGSRLGHIRYGRTRRYDEWRWDGGRRAFMLHGVRATGRPDWILVQNSPLPSTTQDQVLELLREGYTEVTRFIASPLDPEAVYDRQDAFYIPFTGLSRIIRPGPNFTIYKRTDKASSGT